MRSRWCARTVVLAVVQLPGLATVIEVDVRIVVDKRVVANLRAS